MLIIIEQNLVCGSLQIIELTGIDRPAENHNSNRHNDDRQWD